MAPLENSRKPTIYAGALVLFFAALYLLTRSPILASDGEGWIQRATLASAKEFHYGATGHFLQMPLAHLLAGLSGVSLRFVFLALSFLGGVVAICAFFLFLVEFFQRFLKSSNTLFWAGLGAVLFASSYAPWVLWNGEVYSLALFSSLLSAWLLLRGRIAWAGLAWALAVTCHSEFSLLAFAFGWLLYWNERNQGKEAKASAIRVLLFWAWAGAATIAILLTGGFLIGKWHDFTSLIVWFREDLEARKYWLNSGLSPVKAVKGLLTSLTVGGHYLGEFLKGWRPQGAARIHFLLALTCIGGICAFALGTARNLRVLLFGALWLLPLQMLLNWRFLSAVEEYHSASQPGLVFLVVAGMALLSERFRLAPYAALAFVALFFAFNLFAGILPLRARGVGFVEAEDFFKMENAAVLTCDSQNFLDRSKIPYFRIKKNIDPQLPNIEELKRDILEWIEQQEVAGSHVLTIGKACDNDYWIEERKLVGEAPIGTEFTQLSFAFIQNKFTFEPAKMPLLPLNAVVETNPLTWKQSEIFWLKAPAETLNASKLDGHK